MGVKKALIIQHNMIDICVSNNKLSLVADQLSLLYSLTAGC
jgi:hypothetical protein